MAATNYATGQHRVLKPSGTDAWEGRAFGGVVLAAFLLYGIGSTVADRPIGLALVALNSIAVTGAGLIGFRLLLSSQPRIGISYLATRMTEAALLGGGIVLSEVGDSPNAGDDVYQLAMVVLGVGSVPFCIALRRGDWLPRSLALWGIIGYTALATGALLDLVIDRGLAVAFAIPGGLFEVAVGIFLLRRGFGAPR